MKKSNDTLLQLLHVVIDHFITKGEPIGYHPKKDICLVRCFSLAFDERITIINY